MDALPLVLSELVLVDFEHPPEHDVTVFLRVFLLLTDMGREHVTDFPDLTDMFFTPFCLLILDNCLLEDLNGIGDTYVVVRTLAARTFLFELLRATHLDLVLPLLTTVCVTSESEQDSLDEQSWVIV